MKNIKKLAAALLIIGGILAAASEGSAIVNFIGLALMAGGFWMGSKLFGKN